ncbi:hypothetical protein STEG23_034273, partial [Scotinomys teguina]
MKGSPLLVQRTVTRTFELQESIGKDLKAERSNKSQKLDYRQMSHQNPCQTEEVPQFENNGFDSSPGF